MNVKTIIKKGIFYTPLKYIMNAIHTVRKEFALKSTLRSYSCVRGKKILFLLTPEYGNLGDHLIAVGAKAFFTTYLPDYAVCEIPLDNITYSSGRTLRKFSPDFDFVVITGGGFLGNLYLRVEVFFRMILKAFASNRIVVLPQSIFFEDNEEGKREQYISAMEYKKHKNLSVFIRDSSYEFVKKEMVLPVQEVANVPDIALFMNYSGLNDVKRSGCLLCFRDDKEKVLNGEQVQAILKIVKSNGHEIYYTDTVVDYGIPVSNREEMVLKKAAEFAKAKLVITDRLHGMIFAVVTGTPCIALDNTTGKIKGVYNLWLKSFAFIRFAENIKDVTSDMISTLSNLPEQTYNPQLFARCWIKIQHAFL